ncbi:hypothetical protein GGR54DRAFT_21778 [Hypoxylon sp. NC1633]|nr:hypothetical protein GGR54DRAFT_21778 [Hypoxylon sp. NC1633]
MSSRPGQSSPTPIPSPKHQGGRWVRPSTIVNSEAKEDGASPVDPARAVSLHSGVAQDLSWLIQATALEGDWCQDLSLRIWETKRLEESTGSLQDECTLNSLRASAEHFGAVAQFWRATENFLRAAADFWGAVDVSSETVRFIPGAIRDPTGALEDSFRALTDSCMDVEETIVSNEKAMDHLRDLLPESVSNGKYMYLLGDDLSKLCPSLTTRVIEHAQSATPLSPQAPVASSSSGDGGDDHLMLDICIGGGSGYGVRSML